MASRTKSPVSRSSCRIWKANVAGNAEPLTLWAIRLDQWRPDTYEHSMIMRSGRNLSRGTLWLWGVRWYQSISVDTTNLQKSCLHLAHEHTTPGKEVGPQQKTKSIDMRFTCNHSKFRKLLWEMTAEPIYYQLGHRQTRSWEGQYCSFEVSEQGLRWLSKSCQRRGSQWRRLLGWLPSQEYRTYLQ